jgi:hypothetical protein
VLAVPRPASPRQSRTGLWGPAERKLVFTACRVGRRPLASRRRFAHGRALRRGAGPRNCSCPSVLTRRALAAADRSLECRGHQKKAHLAPAEVGEARLSVCSCMTVSRNPSLERGPRRGTALEARASESALNESARCQANGRRAIRVVRYWRALPRTALAKPCPKLGKARGSTQPPPPRQRTCAAPRAPLRCSRMRKEITVRVVGACGSSRRLATSDRRRSSTSVRRRV